MESLYDAALVLLVIFCFRNWGLTGTGIAILLAAIFDFFLLFIYMGWRYEFRLSANIIRYMLLQLPIGVLAFVLAMQTEGWAYWVVGGLLFIVSSGITLQILRSKTHIVEFLRKKLFKK